MKNPWLAAGLNIISGLGYIYLDPKRVFGWLILISTILLSLGLLDHSSSSQIYASSQPTIWDTASMFGGLILWVAFVIDGYAEAVRANRRQQ